MLSTLCSFAVDYLHGLTDSVRGLALLFELDKDEEFVAVNSVPRPTPRTVLQQRREQRGTINRPAEQITRLRVPVWKRIVQCIAVNTILAISLKLLVVVFCFFLGFVTSVPDSMANLAGRFLVLPVFLFTRILMALWFSDIAGACIRSLNLRDPPPVDFRTAVADLVVSILLGLVFLVQSLAVVYLPLPVVSNVVSFVHMALLNSMYSFEYFWSSRSCPLSERIVRLEKRWGYFTGYGSLLTFLTSLSGNFVIDGCIFGALFPLFIISSYRANWRREPAFGSAMPAVHIFTPSMLLTNRLVRLFSNTVTS